MPNDVNTEIADAVTLHRLRLLRFEGGVARDMVTAYASAIADLEAEIKRLAAEVAKGKRGTVRLARLRSLVIGLRPELEAAQVRLTMVLANGTEAAAATEVAKLARLMPQTIGFSWNTPPVDAITRAAQGPIVAPWRARLAADLVQANTQIGAITARGLARGASMDDIAAMLKGASGVIETYRDRMVVIARTEVQRAANEVALASYMANADVLSGVQWLATLDSRTCLRCAPRHNEVYPMVGGRPVTLSRPPPLHPRCRCFLAPVTKGYADLGLPPTHANRTRFDGGPAREQSFGAWLRRQPVDVQLEVLGPSRLPIFRAGASLDDFVVGDQILTVDQLRARTAA